MSKHHCGNASRAARGVCGAVMALVLACLSQLALSQNSGAASPSLQGVGELAGTVGSKRASLIAKIAPQLKAGLTAQEAAAILGSADELKDWDRARAVQSIARANKLGPLGADASQMLQGTTASSRAAGIADLAPYLKANLTAQQAATILGSTGELESWDRARAIQSIARSRTLGPLDAEASQMLQGTTASSRVASVADIAPYLKTDLTAPQAAAILGSADKLEGWDRARAIQSIARAKKLGPLGADAALMLKGTSESSRAAAIADLASHLKTDLAAQEAAAILGSVDELKGWDRARAIQSIARTKKLAPLGQEGALLLKGTIESSRAAGIADLAPYLETDLTAAQAAVILGTAEELAGWDRARAIQSIARAGKVRAGLAEVELAPVLDGTTGSAKAFALAELRAAKPIGVLAEQGRAGGSQPSPSETSSGETAEASASASAVPGQSDVSHPMVAPQCAAPDVATHLYIANPDCRQLWSYHLYRVLAISTFSAQGDLISLAEKRALQVHDFVDKCNLIAAAFHSVATAKTVELSIFNAVWESLDWL